MKTKIILALLLFVLNKVFTQPEFCNLLINGSLESKRFDMINPFTNGMVSNWTASHGQPQLNSLDPLSGPASPEIEADLIAFTTDIGSGIKTTSKIIFKPGKKYYIVFNYKDNGSISTATLNAALVSDISWGTPGNTLPVAGLTGFHNIGSVVVAHSQTHWKKEVFCFTAPERKLDLWFYAKSSATGLCKIGIDNIEIYEDFDFAGTPKTIYTCDTVLRLGMPLKSECNRINEAPEYKWFTTTDTTTLATTSWYDAFPLVKTYYILSRNNGCSTTTDTVLVNAVNKPFFTLPKDTVLCQCQAFELVPNIIDYDGCLDFKWEDGSSVLPRIINQITNDTATFTQKYTLTVTNKCSGCSVTKSIRVTYRPVPNCHKRTQYACALELPMTIETKGTGTGYSWTWLNTAVKPNPPYNTNALSINAVGIYVCKVTDTTGRCSIGYDTLDVHPWEDIKFKIQSSPFDPCIRSGIRLYNIYDVNQKINWYKNGVLISITDYFVTSENGTYVGAYYSPGGLCCKIDSITIKFIDPPEVYIPQKYGSFCKSACDTILDFNYCDTCGNAMGRITKIEWSGAGVSSRIENGKTRYYFCARKARCGNNLLTINISYALQGIVCNKKYYTNIYKVCPMDLDPVPPLCENSNDIFLYDQGSKFSKAIIFGKGVYQENGTGFYKFSVTAAGAGLHVIKYYYTDLAGCEGWDSIEIRVHYLPKVHLKVSGNSWCELQMTVEAVNHDPDYSGYYTIASNIVGYQTLNEGYVRNTILNKTIPVIPDMLYWINVYDDAGCYASASYQYKMKEHFSLKFDSTRCLTNGIPITLFEEKDSVTATSNPGNLAYIWDNDPMIYVSAISLDMNETNYQNLNRFIDKSPLFALYKQKASAVASHTVYTPGWHKITILAIGGCEYADSIFIPFECKNCDRNETQDIIISKAMEVWNNVYKLVKGNIYIKPGANLKISNSIIYFATGSKIVVENSSGNGGPYLGDAATLSVFNSELKGCNNWKGIEVWGAADAYSMDGIQLNLGYDPGSNLSGTNIKTHSGLPNTTVNWAHVYLKNSTIQDADIAIFSGMYDRADSATYHPSFTGGLIFVDESTFFNNYADIVFTPRPGVLMNSIPPAPSWNASYVVRSVFKGNKVINNCGAMYWYDINEFQAGNSKVFSNVNPGFHIVDLTETQYVDINPDSVPVIRYLYYKGPGFYPISFTNSDQHQSTLKRDERIPYTIWHSLYSPSSPLYGKQQSGYFYGLRNVIINSNGNDW